MMERELEPIETTPVERKRTSRIVIDVGEDGLPKVVYYRKHWKVVGDDIVTLTPDRGVEADVTAALEQSFTYTNAAKEERTVTGEDAYAFLKKFGDVTLDPL